MSCFHQKRWSCAGGFGPLVAPQTTTRPLGRTARKAVVVHLEAACQAESPRQHRAGEAVSKFGKSEKREAPPGFEPGMADLQSAALATWLRRLGFWNSILSNVLRQCRDNGTGRFAMRWGNVVTGKGWGDNTSAGQCFSDGAIGSRLHAEVRDLRPPVCGHSTRPTRERARDESGFAKSDSYWRRLGDSISFASSGRVLRRQLWTSVDCAVLLGVMGWWVSSAVGSNRTSTERGCDNWSQL